MKPPVKRTNLVNRIRREITEGVYPNGSRLPIERDFCRELGVARETLRGALKILERKTTLNESSVREPMSVTETRGNFSF